LQLQPHVTTCNSSRLFLRAAARDFPATSFPRRSCRRPSPWWRRTQPSKSVSGWRALEMAVGAARAALVGASARGDQGGAPVSGWWRRSLPVVLRPVRRRKLGWGRAGALQTLDLLLGISASPPHVSLVPWSATAGDGPALLSRCPPHCQPSWCGARCGRCCRVPRAGTINWQRTALRRPPTFLFRMTAWGPAGVLE
jgi:hypothetical protein